MPRGSAKGERRGGRAKGTPNKRTEDLIERLWELDCDPFKGMITIAAGAMGREDFHLAAQMYKELAQYIAPKRKAMEFTVETVREIEAEDLTDQQKSNLIKLLS